VFGTLSIILLQFLLHCIKNLLHTVVFYEINCLYHMQILFLRLGLLNIMQSFRPGELKFTVAFVFIHDIVITLGL